MKVSIRLEIIERELGVPVGNLYYFDRKPLQARRSNENGEFDTDGDYLQVFYEGKWREVISTDWDFQQ